MHSWTKSLYIVVKKQAKWKIIPNWTEISLVHTGEFLWYHLTPDLQLPLRTLSPHLRLKKPNMVSSDESLSEWLLYAVMAQLFICIWLCALQHCIMLIMNYDELVYYYSLLSIQVKKKKKSFWLIIFFPQRDHLLLMIQCASLPNPSGPKLTKLQPRRAAALSKALSPAARPWILDQ